MTIGSGDLGRRVVRRALMFFATVLMMGAAFWIGVGASAPQVAPAATTMGTIFFASPVPAGVVRVAPRTIRWPVWTGQRGLKVERVAMTVNGARVPCIYSETEQAVQYVAPAPLLPGQYRVACQVITSDGAPLIRRWTFTVPPNAALDPPAPDLDQVAAWRQANNLRRMAALPPLRLDERLCLAATSHSIYMERHRQIGHEQTPGREGFVAQGPVQRMAAFGYGGGGGFENVAYGSLSRSASLQRLFDAPYHRLPFLQPGEPSFGAGFAGSGKRRDAAFAATLLFGSTGAAGATVVYPANGQQNVPVRWDGNELPNPLRLHVSAEDAGARRPGGYPITLVRFKPANNSGDSAVGTIVVDRATLTTIDGQPVPFWLNTAANDDYLRHHWPGAVVLLPKEPLQPRTTYQISIAAQSASGGQDLSLTWRFTTGDAPVMLPGESEPGSALVTAAATAAADKQGLRTAGAP